MGRLLNLISRGQNNFELLHATPRIAEDADSAIS